LRHSYVFVEGCVGENNQGLDFEFSDPPGVGEDELGAALVSARAFSEAGGVIVVEAVPAFVSFLLESCGWGAPVPGPVGGERVDEAGEAD